MFKRILVPVDASEYSRHALSTAIEFAKRFNSEIEILHVVHQSMPYLEINDMPFMLYSEQEIHQFGKEVIERTLKGIDIGEIRVNQKIVADYPATAILNEIKRDIDLVVMGSRGHGPFAGAILGSVTQRVLAESDCPVLVVR